MAKRGSTNKGIGLLLAVWAIVFAATPLHADIYKYRDKNGVFHFTNVPTSPKYEIFIKERVIAPLHPGASSRFDHLINRAADQHGVESPLVKAIIRAESGFNPKAVSKKGAMGLMQIMPQNIKPLNIKDPFDPWENILGGTLYFKRMLKRYKGTLRLALAAYNAGPSAVDQYNSIPPYPETQEYVRKVLLFYRAYKLKS